MSVIPFPRLFAKCRKCGSKEWTMLELNLSPDQDGICYYCLSDQRRELEEKGLKP